MTATEDRRVVLSIRSQEGRIKSFRLPLPATFGSEAMRWAYIARSRRRWSDQQKPAEELMTHLLSKSILQEIGAAGLVEVSVPYAKEAYDWDARIFPWEYMLSQATKPYRSSSLTVVRHLDHEASAADSEPIDWRRPRIVLARPTSADHPTSDDVEAQVVLASLGLNVDATSVVAHPTREELQRALKPASASVLHISGLDNHEAATLWGVDRRRAGDAEAAAARLDGLALRSAVRPSPDFVDAQTLSRLLAGAREKPQLVFFNLFNSAARIAPLTVAAGAGAAIGLQDTIDAELAVVFYTSFYRALAAEEGELLSAFRAGLDAVRLQPRGLRGACFVLWSGSSLLRASRLRRRAARPTTMRDEAARSFALEDRDCIRVDWQLTGATARLSAAEINYSVLHNGGSLFQNFVLHNIADRPIRDVHVELVLHVGPDSFPYRTTVDLGSRPVELKDRIAIPLTSALMRTASERIQSTLFMQVTQGTPPNLVLRDTLPVTLIPVDEWIDDDNNRRWLPSFVLPRDPAVARIVDSAQRYLMALTDDPAAGFDGYQSGDTSLSERALLRHPVDLQVQALWSALLYEHRLSYINPPPAYSESDQRLRTPSDVLAERRGTCIDLALLLASCLEFVEIYPVIFLLEGHAFPGYWRHDSFHERFERLVEIDVPAGEVDDQEIGRGTSSDPRANAYTLGKGGYFEVAQLIRRGVLVPLESTLITGAGPFSLAQEEGIKNLRRKSEFHSMLDVVLARRERVTPLPILEEGR